MATPKFFHVRNVPQDRDFLVRATKAELAIAAVDGTRAEIRPATDQQITDHFTGGGTLHPKSIPEGQGKFFLVPVLADVSDSLTLVRAKNAQSALLAVNEGVYTAEVASQETLVKLLTTSGLTPIDAVPKSTPEAAPGTPAAQPEATAVGAAPAEGAEAASQADAATPAEAAPALAEA